MINRKRLKRLRRLNDLTQEELGTILGVNASTICNYESGIRTPPLEVFIKIIEYFGCSADYLLGVDKACKTDKDIKRYELITDEEITFLSELKKDSNIYDMILENPSKYAEIIKANLK